MGRGPAMPHPIDRQFAYSSGRSRPMTGPRLFTTLLCLAGFAATGFFIWNSGLPNGASQASAHRDPLPARLAFAGSGPQETLGYSTADAEGEPEPEEEVETPSNGGDYPARGPAVEPFANSVSAKAEARSRNERTGGNALPTPSVEPRREPQRSGANAGGSSGRTPSRPTGAALQSAGVSGTSSGIPRAASRRTDALDEPPAELNIIEPYRTINVAAEEVGTIQEILVREGDVVKQGQILARLNSTVLFAQLAIAEQNSQAQGRLEASLAELRLREHRFSQLRSLRTDGAARQEEVDRAESEVAIAQANVRTAREELESRRLECERIKAQIDSRSVKAPIDGVVVKMLKDVGEFVAPNTPDVMTVVQINQLIARCNISANMLDQVKAGQEHDIRLATGETVKGMIEFVDPVTDGASQMVTVKLRIDNSHGRFRSGEQCWMPLSQ